MKIELTALLVFELLLCTPCKPATSCSPIDGVEQVLGAPGVFVGEMHGSVETPAFLSALACHAVKSGKSLVVALEYDAKDQVVLDRFLQSVDEPKALSTLTSTPYWTDNRDGRASGAMRDALLAIRRLALAGGRVNLIAYDLGGETSAEREKKSADLLRRVRVERGGAEYWIVIGGNVHARKTKGLPFVNAPSGSDDHEPLGFLIRDWGLIHLNAGYRVGAVWACIGPSPDNCRRVDLGPGCSADCPAHPTIRLSIGDPAYDGVYEVGRLTVSEPLNRHGKN